MSHKSQRMIVISFDLCRYSEITVGQTIGGEGEKNPIVITNEAIHNAIIEPLKEIAKGYKSLRYYIKSTGDGALVFFPPEHAHVAIDYIRNFQSQAEHENRKCIARGEIQGNLDENALRFYRVGCAVGDISIYVVSKHAGADFAGVAIADSVRIESNGRAGEILISNEVYSLLDPVRKHEFGRKKKITGKHGSEKYVVRTIPPRLIAPWEEQHARKYRRRGFWAWSAAALIPILIYELRIPLAALLLSLP